MTLNGRAEIRGGGPTGSSRRPHRWRWAIGGVVLLIVVVIGAAVAFVVLPPTPAPLALPRAASAPVGRLEGTWEVASGSLAGFRLRETVLGMSNDVVGRTNEVAGTVVISTDSVSAASFRINLRSVKVGGGIQAQFAQDLGARDHRYATLSLARPVSFSAAFASGGTVLATTTGRLAMNGESHIVRFTISARRDGPRLEIAGSIPVALAEWGIRAPKGFGFLGSLANRGVAEFLVVLRRH
jgi:polyisoprenoid-binding protein YceI